jgi:hypothetical protein
MVQTFQYWRPGMALQNVAPGIEILVNDTDYDDVDWEYNGETYYGYPDGFAQHAADNLNYVYATNAGQTVLDYLINHNILLRVTFARLGNDAGAGNPQASMSQVAFELYHNRQPGHHTQNALQALAPGNQGFALFAAKVNEQPKWDIDIAPGGFLAGVLSMVGQGGYGLNLTANEAQAWVQHGTAPGRLNDEGKLQLRLATVVALEAHSTAGPGSGSRVGLTFNPGNELNRERPPGIGLAHELVHAYYSSRGEQPGHEGPQDATTVLFEFKCVGLGPWDGAAISENGIRNQWYKAVWAFWSTMDEQNRRIPFKRQQY